MTDNTRSWGFHLMVNAANCDRLAVTNPDTIREFSKTLVERIDMKAYGEPQVVHFAEHAADKSGYTLVQLIETSNICAHFVDESGDLYLDVFSCKEFDAETVMNTVAEFFNPTGGSAYMVERDAYNGFN